MDITIERIDNHRIRISVESGDGVGASDSIARELMDALHAHAWRLNDTANNQARKGRRAAETVTRARAERVHAWQGKIRSVLDEAAAEERRDRAAETMRETPESAGWYGSLDAHDY